MRPKSTPTVRCEPRERAGDGQILKTGTRTQELAYPFVDYFAHPSNVFPATIGWGHDC